MGAETAQYWLDIKFKGHAFIAILLDAIAYILL